MKHVSLDQWKQLDSLVDEALQHPADERTAFVRAKCGHDVDFYNQAIRLLDKVQLARDALGDSVADYVAPILDAEHEEDRVPDLNSGTEIGAYRIVREIGRGGMGAVYLAERADGTFEKQVALKLVKRGMDTDEVVYRFRRERQIHAALDHPGIARLLDAGAAQDGRPFLVMEYVGGQPITTFCDERKLDVESRLQLFEQVCEAVKYAHRRLVIHRDLKPSNILVVEEAGESRIKLLDFGIARLLDPEQNESVTRVGARPLTPAYAAPEQLEGGSITTAIDVYALGVVLHELLAGCRPKDPERCLGACIDRETAASRSLTLDRLRKKLSGDLNTIAQTALRTNVDDRYPSVESLLDDLQRYRRNMPIEARPATRTYRLRKFVLRNRMKVAIGALVLIALAGGAGIALWQASEAREHAQRSDDVRDFLIQILEEANPDYAQSDTLAVGAMLELAAGRIENDLSDQPEMQAELMGILAEIYRKLDRYDRSSTLFERAIELQRELKQPLQLAIVLNGLAGVRLEEGDFEDSERLYLEALALRRRHAPRSEDELNTTANLGNLYRMQKQLVEADSFLTMAAEMQREIGIEDRSVFAITLDRIASLRRTMGRFSEAEAISREALDLRLAALGPGHRHVYLSKNNLGLILYQSGQLDAAEEMYEDVYDFYIERLGAEHRETATALLHLGEVAYQRGRFSEAAQLLRQASGVYRTLLGNEHGSVANVSLRLAEALIGKNEGEEAEELARGALAFYLESYGQQHQDVGSARRVLGDVLFARGKLDEAQLQYQQSAGILRNALGDYHPRLAAAIVGLGRVSLTQGNTETAERLLTEALHIREVALNADALELAEARLYLGECLLARNEPEAARVLLEPSLGVLQDQRVQSHPTLQKASVLMSEL